MSRQGRDSETRPRLPKLAIFFSANRAGHEEAPDSPDNRTPYRGCPCLSGPLSRWTSCSCPGLSDVSGDPNVIVPNANDLKLLQPFRSPDKCAMLAVRLCRVSERFCLEISNQCEVRHAHQPSRQYLKIGTPSRRQCSATNARPTCMGCDGGDKTDSGGGGGRSCCSCFSCCSAPQRFALPPRPVRSSAPPT
jgi:hypothetical protein